MDTSTADDRDARGDSELEQEEGGYEDDSEYEASDGEGAGDHFDEINGSVPFVPNDKSIRGEKFRPLNPELPETVTVLDHPTSGGRVYIVGTAHFGSKSQEDVATTIRQLMPDYVVLELCPERKAVLTIDENAQQVDPTMQDFNQMVKRTGVSQAVLQFCLLKLSAHCTSKLGMTPGGEMRCAYREACKLPDCMILLGDRPISITLKRAFGSLSLWQKMQFLWVVMREMKTDISQEDVEKCKSNDVLEELIEKLSEEFPTLHRVLVSERDLFLAHILKSSIAKPIARANGPQPGVVVGVVGIGHVSGIKRAWKNDTMTPQELNDLLAIPQRSTGEKVLGVAVRVSLLALMGYGSYRLGRFAWTRLDLGRFTKDGFREHTDIDNPFRLQQQFLNILKNLKSYSIMMKTISWLAIVLVFTAAEARGVVVKHAEANTRDRVTSPLPEQVHLSWDGDASHMTVTWSTVLSASTVVQYQLTKFDNTSQPMEVNGQQTKFVDPAKAQRTQYIHRGVMVDLLPKTFYYYRVGDGVTWTEVFRFRSLQSGSDWNPRLAVFGDLGVENAQSMKRLKRDVLKGRIDMVIHVGDFGYDLNDDDGRVGDAFLRMMQPVAATVPYQTVVGNHESFANFTHYKNRFTMPGGNDGMFYDFTVGPATFVVFSTEFYFYLQFGEEQITRQYTWLEKELKRLNHLAARKKTPWIITLGHRPMYCSNDDGDDCTLRDSIIRTGNRTRGWKSLERLFHRHGVDLCVWAHEHSYERMWPVYNRQVFNGSNPSNPYDNPGAPVHVVSGSAGCKEKTDNFLAPTEWDAFRNSDYGYMRMHVRNRTHITVEQVSDEKGGGITDTFTLVKTRTHGFRYH
ncbi:Acid phosphatase type 7 [Hypsibius exemplaris]|uniref:Purple acid phosphatase n=1 Tax=Hypsibius exemplaris TaxID=2072580 RepID=A0A1W0WXZ0_HYPEX|nr:Acid phosphatase type 7 [Hypsibius exemplaris]